MDIHGALGIPDFAGENFFVSAKGGWTCEKKQNQSGQTQ
jgi:hypothetical protein